MIRLFTALLITAAFLGVGLSQPRPAAASLPQTVAASVEFCEKKANGPLGFLGLEPWYHFMSDSSLGTHGDPCAIKCFNIFPQANPNACGQTASDIPGVVLAIIDDLLRLAALVAVAFIIIGSFQYVGSRGNSERTAAAQTTIMNALTGLAVALVAVALISFIGNQLH
ncbi:MAG TPA: hypothetical protein VFX84_03450 [Candidatus Saccharimonadales bacterium]|nr:hypothetical protein [Candidatus Saccharimonadales bacterium]